MTEPQAYNLTPRALELLRYLREFIGANAYAPCFDQAVRLLCPMLPLRCPDVGGPHLPSEARP